MIHYSCDICGKECNDKIFTLPIAATFIGQEPCDLMPINMNLCRSCRSEIYKVIEKKLSKEKVKKLHDLALNIKMNKMF